jgi:hypothetical protein
MAGRHLLRLIPGRASAGRSASSPQGLEIQAGRQGPQRRLATFSAIGRPPSPATIPHDRIDFDLRARVERLCRSQPLFDALARFYRGVGGRKSRR